METWGPLRPVAPERGQLKIYDLQFLSNIMDTPIGHNQWTFFPVQFTPERNHLIPWTFVVRSLRKSFEPNTKHFLYSPPSTSRVKITKKTKNATACLVMVPNVNLRFKRKLRRRFNATQHLERRIAVLQWRTLKCATETYFLLDPQTQIENFWQFYVNGD